MRYTPLEILKDEAQALFQLEQNMTKKIFDENFLSSTNQVLVDEKSLYRLLEVMQESIFRPKEVHKLFADMDTQSDEENFQALDQFTGRLGNYIDTITPIFTILKNAMSKNTPEKANNISDANVYIQKQITILEDNILNLNEKIDFVESMKETSLELLESDGQLVYDGLAIASCNQFAIKVSKVPFDFEVYADTEIEEVKEDMENSLEKINENISEANTIIENIEWENPDLEQLDQVIEKYDSGIKEFKRIFRKFCAMFHTLSRMLMNVAADADDYMKQIQLSNEIEQEVMEKIKISFIEWGDYEEFDFLHELAENKKDALYESFDLKSYEEVLIGFKSIRDTRKYLIERTIKQSELMDLKIILLNTSNHQQKDDFCGNDLIEDFTISLEIMKERNKSLKQYIEKYI